MWLPSRRDFLGVSAAALSSAGFPEPSNTQSSSTTYVYAAESMAPGVRESPFVVGFLIARDPATHLQRLADIKKSTGYRRQIKHHTNDEYKIGCVREFIRYFAESNLRFAARARSLPAGSARVPDASRVREYQALFNAANLPKGAVLRMKHRSAAWDGTARGKAELDARVSVLNGAGLISDSRTIVSMTARGRGAQEWTAQRRDALLELCSLLTGSVFWTLAVPAFGSRQRRNRFKAAPAERLHSALRVTNLVVKVPGKWEVTREAAL